MCVCFALPSPHAVVSSGHGIARGVWLCRTLVTLVAVHEYSRDTGLGLGTCEDGKAALENGWASEIVGMLFGPRG